LIDIAESTDETELSRLLQLVLGCAVSCDRKQFYIEHIMSLEESVQHVLMNAIQEVHIKILKKQTSFYLFDIFLVDGKRKSKNE
jgi:hypothetical protein